MKCDTTVIMAYVAKKRSTNRLRIKPNFCISSIKPLIYNDWKLYTDNVFLFLQFFFIFSFPSEGHRLMHWHTTKDL